MNSSFNAAHTLSKSNFKIAQNCPTKLYYKKHGYPSANDGNEYMEYLAEGGYAVGAMAKMYYPEGVEIDSSNGADGALKQTEELLLLENVVLFEAMVYSENKLVAIDILEKVGNHFNLIEVKSKGVDPTAKLGGEWNENLEDITYQMLTLQECYPDCTIDSFLYVPNKTVTTDIENLYSQFKLENVSDGNGFQSFKVSFTGDREEIINDKLLVQVNVSNKVAALSDYVAEQANAHIAQLQAGTKPNTQIDRECFKCEYTVAKENGEPSGYDECWAHITKPEHHIKDLYQLGRVKRGQENLANALINENKVSLADIPFETLTMSYKFRQKIQINNTLEGTEWRAEEMDGFMSLVSYPLHFIDFETMTTALPFHSGMRPYEMIAFQWSCHTIESPGSEPVHSEWLNTEPSYPDFRFAEALFNQIGQDNGTIFTWATHENTVLRNIYEKMILKNYDNPELLAWLKKIVKFKDEPGELFDMNSFTLSYYFHPLMKGKTSIKSVLPAVLSATDSSRIEQWLQNFDTQTSLLTRNASGKIENPYKNLPKDEGIDVSEGTGAMRGYAEMLYGNEKTKSAYEKALLKYCKLDTLAMVIIWEHWESIR